MSTHKTILVTILILFVTQKSFAQQIENQKWEKIPIQYAIPIESHEIDLDLKFIKPIDYLLKPLLNLYRITISDADGSVCQFEPSCSQFFIAAVEETNFIEGLLLFSDRFQRDANVFNRMEYPLSKNRRLIDPVERYLSK